MPPFHVKLSKYILYILKNKMPDLLSAVLVWYSAHSALYYLFLEWTVEIFPILYKVCFCVVLGCQLWSNSFRIQCFHITYLSWVVGSLIYCLYDVCWAYLDMLESVFFLSRLILDRVFLTAWLPEFIILLLFPKLMTKQQKCVSGLDFYSRWHSPAQKSKRLLATWCTKKHTQAQTP